MAEGTNVARYDERFAAMAEQYAANEKVSGDFLSLKGGVLTFQDEPLPGNQMCVVILDAILERTFYAEKYDAAAEHNKPPICYAFARLDGSEDIDEIGPHISMSRGLHYFEPQSEICRTCPNNQWGSADTGRGKACAERRRLAILPAGFYEPKKGSRDFTLTLVEDEEHYANADIAYLKTNVMSVKDYARYVTELRAEHRRPPLGAITRVYVEPDPKSQFRVKFELIELLPDTLYDTIFERYEEAKAGIVIPYNAPDGEEAGASRKGGIRR